MDFCFADRMSQIRPSTIRQILKVTEQPEVISFAGGLPAPECFPVQEIATCAERVLSEAGAQALQYAVTEGYAPLRERFAAEMATRGVACNTPNILITTGSQQALDLIGKVFLNPGDCVLTETPTYLAAIQAFQAYGVRFVSAVTDENGLVPESLEEIITRERPKILYTIPNFQNPTGVTLSAARRQQILEIAARHRMVIVEDDPYGKLRYAGTDIAPIKASDAENQVIYVSTVSKTVTPGLRIGWVTAHESILQHLIVAKQAADLHASNLDQRIVERYFADFDNQQHIERIRQTYGARFTCMNQALEEFMPAGFHWTLPQGGMFLWVTCPSHLSTQQMLPKAIERKILFVPGRDFFPNGGGDCYMRLNFSNASEQNIRIGISRLADLVREFPS